MPVAGMRVPPGSCICILGACFLSHMSAPCFGYNCKMSDMPSGWISGVREDLALLRHHPDCRLFRGVSVGGTIGIISQDPRYWHNRIRTRLKLPYYSLIITDKGQEGPPSLYFAEDPTEPTVVHTCDVCGAVEPTYKRIRYHHQIKNQVRKLRRSVIFCPICNTFHHT